MSIKMNYIEMNLRQISAIREGFNLKKQVVLSSKKRQFLKRMKVI